MPVSFRHLSQEELDFQHSPSQSAKDFMGVLARHEAETAALDDLPGLRVTRDIAYGAAPRTAMDLVVPAGQGPCPCLAFIHGGFWQEGSRAASGFASRALAGQGWATSLVGYSLTPDVRLRDIVGEIAAAVTHLRVRADEHGIDPDRIFLAGHSAGGHLAAAMLVGMGGAAAAQAVAGAVLISGVYDLAPVAASYVNDLARMDADEIERLSPLSARPVRDVPVHILVGADEPDTFRQQSGALRSEWAPHLSRLSFDAAPGRDHFDVLDELADPNSPTFRALMEMV